MRQIHEQMTRFFEEPTRDRLRDILKFQVGEFSNLDFKKLWPEASKLARHVLAFSNSGGGMIIIGVEETADKTLRSCGIETVMDKSIIDNQLRGYLSDRVEYDILDFCYKDSEYGVLIGKSFQVLLIKYDANYIPHISQKDGKGISGNSIYVRQGTDSVLASYNEVQKLLNERISTNYDTSSDIELEEHLNQLKILYNKIDKNTTTYRGGLYTRNPFGGLFSALIGSAVVEKNPFYPEEEFDEYISKVISMKKARIEKLLDI